MDGEIRTPGKRGEREAASPSVMDVSPATVDASATSRRSEASRPRAGEEGYQVALDAWLQSRERKRLLGSSQEHGGRPGSPRGREPAGAAPKTHPFIRERTPSPRSYDEILRRDAPAMLQAELLSRQQHDRASANRAALAKRAEIREKYTVHARPPAAQSSRKAHAAEPPEMTLFPAPVLGTAALPRLPPRTSPPPASPAPAQAPRKPSEAARGIYQEVADMRRESHQLKQQQQQQQQQLYRGGHEIAFGPVLMGQRNAGAARAGFDGGSSRVAADEFLGGRRGTGIVEEFPSDAGETMNIRSAALKRGSRAPEQQQQQQQQEQQQRQAQQHQQRPPRLQSQRQELQQQQQQPPQQHQQQHQQHHQYQQQQQPPQQYQQQHQQHHQHQQQQQQPPQQHQQEQQSHQQRQHQQEQQYQRQQRQRKEEVPTTVDGLENSEGDVTVSSGWADSTADEMQPYGGGGAARYDPFADAANVAVVHEERGGSTAAVARPPVAPAAAPGKAMFEAECTNNTSGDSSSPSPAPPAVSVTLLSSHSDASRSDLGEWSGWGGGEGVNDKQPQAEAVPTAAAPPRVTAAAFSAAAEAKTALEMLAAESSFDLDAPPESGRPTARSPSAAGPASAASRSGATLGDGRPAPLDSRSPRSPDGLSEWSAATVSVNPPPRTEAGAAEAAAEGAEIQFERTSPSPDPEGAVSFDVDIRDAVAAAVQSPAAEARLLPTFSPLLVPHRASNVSQSASNSLSDPRDDRKPRGDIISTFSPGSASFQLGTSPQSSSFRPDTHPAASYAARDDMKCSSGRNLSPDSGSYRLSVKERQSSNPSDKSSAKKTSDASNSPQQPTEPSVPTPVSAPVQPKIAGAASLGAEGDDASVSSADTEPASPAAMRREQQESSTRTAHRALLASAAKVSPSEELKAAASCDILSTFSPGSASWILGQQRSSSVLLADTNTTTPTDPRQASLEQQRLIDIIDTFSPGSASWRLGKAISSSLSTREQSKASHPSDSVERGASCEKAGVAGLDKKELEKMSDTFPDELFKSAIALPLIETPELQAADIMSTFSPGSGSWRLGNTVGGSVDFGELTHSPLGRLSSRGSNTLSARHALPPVSPLNLETGSFGTPRGIDSFLPDTPPGEGRQVTLPMESSISSRGSSCPDLPDPPTPHEGCELEGEASVGYRPKFVLWNACERESIEASESPPARAEEGGGGSPARRVKSDPVRDADDFLRQAKENKAKRPHPKTGARPRARSPSPPPPKPETPKGTRTVELLVEALIGYGTAAAEDAMAANPATPNQTAGPPNSPLGPGKRASRGRSCSHPPHRAEGRTAGGGAAPAAKSNQPRSRSAVAQRAPRQCDGWSKLLALNAALRDKLTQELAAVRKKDPAARKRRELQPRPTAGLSAKEQLQQYLADELQAAALRTPKVDSPVDLATMMRDFAASLSTATSPQWSSQR
ncbi:hypothetical protein DIPPA_29013 [Diplonema papillatum]|nr:hypothetical protein DIPPA_29013 [Diplonema papillatum]